MWNEIKNLFKRLFGLVDTNHDGKVSTQEAQAADFNGQAVATAAKADIKATAEGINAVVQERVARVQEEVQDVIDGAKETVHQVKDIAMAAKGGTRRGRKSKA